jgi:hypothetical protein
MSEGLTDGKEKLGPEQELLQRLSSGKAEIARTIETWSFPLNPDGTFGEGELAALKAIQRKDGYSLYGEIRARIDTDYARAHGSGGSKPLCPITESDLLAWVPDGATLHRFNMISVEKNVNNLPNYVFEEMLVAQAPSEVIGDLDSKQNGGTLIITEPLPDHEEI